ncbi:hypothetical protein COLO4_02883 [Corchorus olitorius]|uniref:Uncharacterized protein n=1 Tax=Corchorus olitorius TaxID=93759 RepID=A0A1R3L024_9ROSI|nr:hypothetical protein COLO4_02883 [Corchorus olitorius]
MAKMEKAPRHTTARTHPYSTDLTKLHFTRQFPNFRISN